MSKNIALIGHMGSGKTLIGKLIARELNFKHIDSDQQIEKITNKSINNIFDSIGEKGFRNIEENIILNLFKVQNIVLSLGGGSILSKKIRSFLKKEFITVFLDVNIKVLKQRLQNSYKRPLLLNANIEKKFIKLDKERRKYYLLANIVFQNFENPKETVKKLIKEYYKLDEKNN